MNSVERNEITYEKTQKTSSKVGAGAGDLAQVYRLPVTPEGRRRHIENTRRRCKRI